MKTKKNILIAGPIFPPAGGISIHIHRLEQLLQDDYLFSFIDEAGLKKKNIFNIRSMNVFRYMKLIRKADLFFIHSGNPLFKKLHIVFGRLFRKKIIVALHGYGNERAPFFKTIDSFFFNRANRIMLVNDHIAGKLHLNAEKCIVKHAFLPPAMSQEKPLPVMLSEKIDLARKSGSIIICGNASRLNTFNNQDLYGVDMCLDASKSLNDQGIPNLFIFVVTSVEVGKDRFDNALRYIADNHMGDYFLLLNEELSFVNLIASADVVLRPTNTDGDALTVREALFLNKAVLASDVVDRPAGTLLFKTRDNEDLNKKLLDLAKKIKSEVTVKSVNIQDAMTEDKNYYTGLFNQVMNQN